MRTTVYIIRHAEAEGNVYRRCHGQYNALLTTRAYKQLPYLAKRFENVPLAAVYSSDLFHTLKSGFRTCKFHTSIKKYTVLLSLRYVFLPLLQSLLFSYLYTHHSIWVPENVPAL